MENRKCSFAYAGTYGHECGAAATLAAKKASRYTVNGIYWAARCEKCAKVKGGENVGLGAYEALDAAKHANVFKSGVY